MKSTEIIEDLALEDLSEMKAKKVKKAKKSSKDEKKKSKKSHKKDSKRDSCDSGAESEEKIIEKKSKSEHLDLNEEEDVQAKKKASKKARRSEEEQIVKDVLMEMKNGFGHNDDLSNGDNDVDEGTEPDLDPQVKKEMEEGNFDNFQLSEETKQKLKIKGIEYLFPVQAGTFEAIYEGKDALVQARTGTGKTLAFALPIVEKLQRAKSGFAYGRGPQVIMLAPTRELALQIAENICSVISQKSLRVLCVYGGSSFDIQRSSIQQGTDIIVGTPGRVLDLLKRSVLNFSCVQYAVLDEVDRMLDMGFSDNVEEILGYAFSKAKVPKPQMLLFSATMPDWVHKNADKFLSQEIEGTFSVDFVGRQANQGSTTVEHLAIKSSYHDRASAIGDVLSVYSGKHGRAMVFCQTKRDADELTCSSHIKQDCHVLHGDIPQDKRELVLTGFREGTYRVLITTDVAARGLDIPEVDLVIQCSPPRDVDSYIHRSGRTGRAGRKGVCVCFYKPYEERELQTVERKAKIKFRRVGVPSSVDIIRSSAEDAIKSINAVGEKTIEHFRAHADMLVQARGAVDALASALAVISGATDIKSRSLLNSQQGFTTYIFKSQIEMNYLGYTWKALERTLGEQIRQHIRSMTLTADKKGCVFDLASQMESFVADHWTDGKNDTLEVATELPPLLERENLQQYGGGGGFRGRGRGRGGSRGAVRGTGFRPRGGSRGQKRSFNDSGRGDFKRGRF